MKPFRPPFPKCKIIRKETMIVHFVAIHPIETDDELVEVLRQTAAHLLNKQEDH